MGLRDDCLIAGISERDFWEMNPGECTRALNAFSMRRKDIAYFSYTTAMAISTFIGSVFSSATPPTISDIYPDLFPKEEQEQVEKEVEHEIRMSKSEANFLKFANAYNQRYEANGNRKSESKNNG